jgi:hypothetical protein
VAIDIRRLTGEAPKAALDDLAGLRIAVFRAWPYLYEGTRVYTKVSYRARVETIRIMLPSFSAM